MISFDSIQTIFRKEGYVNPHSGFFILHELAVSLSLESSIFEMLYREFYPKLVRLFHNEFSSSFKSIYDSFITDINSRVADYSNENCLDYTVPFIIATIRDIGHTGIYRNMVLIKFKELITQSNYPVIYSCLFEAVCHMTIAWVLPPPLNLKILNHKKSQIKRLIVLLPNTLFPYIFLFIYNQNFGHKRFENSKINHIISRTHSNDIHRRNFLFGFESRQFAFQMAELYLLSSLIKKDEFSKNKHSVFLEKDFNANHTLLKSFVKLNNLRSSNLFTLVNEEKDIIPCGQYYYYPIAQLYSLYNQMDSWSSLFYFYSNGLPSSIEDACLHSLSLTKNEFLDRYHDLLSKPIIFVAFKGIFRQGHDHPNFKGWRQLQLCPTTIYPFILRKLKDMKEVNFSIINANESEYFSKNFIDVQSFDSNIDKARIILLLLANYSQKSICIGDSNGCFNIISNLSSFNLLITPPIETHYHSSPKFIKSYPKLTSSILDLSTKYLSPRMLLYTMKEKHPLLKRSNNWTHGIHSNYIKSFMYDIPSENLQKIYSHYFRLIKAHFVNDL